MLNAQQKYDLNIDQNLINPTFSPDDKKPAAKKPDDKKPAAKEQPKNK